VLIHGKRHLLNHSARLPKGQMSSTIHLYRTGLETYVLEERAPEYFINCRYAPFMVITYNVRPDKVKEIPIPTHVDNTARIQTISRNQNGIYYDLISDFEDETGIPMVTNTSLNVMNQPICLSPVDALSTFISTGMDGIAIGNYLLLKGNR
jgi:carbamoyltransferase